MSRLIDADALKEAIKEWRYHGYYDKLIEVIDNAPTVEAYTEDDVQYAIREGHQVGYEMAKAKFERPQGEWIPTVIDTGLFERSVCREWQCSNCGEVVKMKYPFCHCGADMRKGGRE